jgi:hypothetical protein
MQKIKYAVAFALIAATTAACVETTTTHGYPSQAYRSNSGGYWNSPRADYDRDGVPNRYDRDANGDRIPDRYQGR